MYCTAAADEYLAAVFFLSWLERKVVSDLEIGMLCRFSRVFLWKVTAGNSLLERAGSIGKVFSMSGGEIDRCVGIPGIGSKLLDREKLEEARIEARWYMEHKVHVIGRLSEDYPKLLKECGDGPCVLYFRGSLPLGSLMESCGGRVLAVVGTRLATAYGIEACGEIVGSVASCGYNPLIVSGLARGIDIAAHRVAMDNGLKTIAVLPCGIDSVYPAAHRQDAIRIMENGGILTEFPRGEVPKRLNLLKRNRIIAGMSEALLVGETRMAGGSMSTVKCASSYGRDIFAVPGRLCDSNSCGCNYLISKNIAAIYIDSSSISGNLGWNHFAERGCAEDGDSLFGVSPASMKKLLLTLSPVKFRSADELVQLSGLQFDEVMVALVELETDNKVRRNSSGEYALCRHTHASL